MVALPNGLFHLFTSPRVYDIYGLTLPGGGSLLAIEALAVFEDFGAFCFIQLGCVVAEGTFHAFVTERNVEAWIAEGDLLLQREAAQSPSLPFALPLLLLLVVVMSAVSAHTVK